MNKLITIIASCLFLLTFMSSCNRTDEERSHILKVYNWADYIDEDVLAEFPAWYKEQTGEDIRIIYQVFDINEIMLTKIERGHEDFDLICPSEYNRTDVEEKPSCPDRPQFRKDTGLSG